MPSRPAAPSPKLPFSLRQELFAHPGVFTTLALAVVNAAVSTVEAAPPGATPAPLPPDTNPRRDAQATPAQLPEVQITGDRESYQPERVNSPKYPEPLLDTPQSISVVPKKVIQDQNATNLRDVLRNVPGITIQAGEGGNTPGDNFVIRGFSARTDLYVDGVRDVNGYFRDPYNIEQVEVTKGPASVYNGRGSTGGSINLVTKTPGVNPFYAATAGVGTDNYYRGTVDLNQPIRLGWDSNRADNKNALPPEPTAALRLNGVWYSADVPGRDVASNQRWGLAPSLAFGLGTPTQLTLSYSHLQQNNMPDFGVPWVTVTNNALASKRNQPAPVSFSNYYGLNQRDHEKLRTDEATALLTHVFNEDLNARYTFHYGRNYRDSIISAPRFVSDDSTEINREFQSRDEIDTVLTNALDVTWRVATFGLEHTLVGGLEFTQETFQNRLRDNPPSPLADLYHPDANDDFDGKVSRTGDVNEADTNTYAFYLFDTIKLGEHWQLSGGLRGDYYAADYDMHLAAGPTTSFDRIDKVLSWRTALVYKPVSNGSIYFGYGTSFNPSAEGLVLTAATAALKPERNSTFELGTKWDVLDRRLSLTGAVFYTLKENSRTPGETASDPVTVLQGEQQVLGFELEAKGHLTKDWEVFGGYTYLDTQITKSNTPAEVGNELPGVPRNAFNLWTTYQLPWNLEVGLGSQFEDQRFANPINSRNAGSFLTFDAMMAWKVNKNLTLRVNVYNLTDEEYIGALHIGGSYGHFFPGPTRSATFTASVLF